MKISTLLELDTTKLPTGVEKDATGKKLRPGLVNKKTKTDATTTPVGGTAPVTPQTNTQLKGTNPNIGDVPPGTQGRLNLNPTGTDAVEPKLDPNAPLDANTPVEPKLDPNAPLDANAQAKADPTKAKATADPQDKRSTWDKVKDFGQDAANVGGSLSRGVQNVTGIAGGAVKGVGDLASQTVGGAAQTVGAGFGGFKHGYNTAAQGGRFGQTLADLATGQQNYTTPGNSSSGVAGGANGVDSQASNATNDEVAQLKSDLAKIDQRLQKKGI